MLKVVDLGLRAVPYTATAVKRTAVFASNRTVYRPVSLTSSQATGRDGCKDGRIWIFSVWKIGGRHPCAVFNFPWILGGGDCLQRLPNTVGISGWSERSATSKNHRNANKNDD